MPNVKRVMSNEELNRYNRQIILPEIGLGGQVKLKQAKVLVVGAGGLGCPVLLYLCAAGVGNIGVVDGDMVDESNLQRQVLYCSDDIGKNKAGVAKGKLLKQNPHIHLTAHCMELTTQNAASLISDYDIVVDGSDNFPTRYLLNDACVYLNKPFVFGSIYKFQGQVSVFNFMGGPTYRCLYSNPPGEDESPNCSETGVIGTLPGIIGTLQANEVIKIITGAGETLSGKLLVFNSLNMHFDTYRFYPVAGNKDRSILDSYTSFCNTPAREISAEDLKLKTDTGERFQLIDVREPSENAADNIGGTLIPLRSLLSNADKINKEIPVILYCQSGTRSKKGVELLMGNGFQNVVSLSGGLEKYRKF
jgi:molybdopterin/thiamine biosynthesis adenylyltransferase/rhodanese-related sulfurtransferase